MCFFRLGEWLAMTEKITQNDMEELSRAKALLENPGLAVKLTHLIGSPLESGLKLLPENVTKLVMAGSEKALLAAVNSALLTLKEKENDDSSDSFHRALAASSGAVGGFFGLPALMVELPVSTTIMMRSIADIARAEGHKVSEPQVRIACVEVFALGGPGKDDDGAETGYFAIRTLLTNAVNDAVNHLATKGISEKGAPVILRLISMISSRFGVQISEKIVAQSIPIIGAAGGALINTLFMEHYQAIARGHFIVLRLEKKYSKALVRQAYEVL